MFSPQGRMVAKLQPIVNEPERIGKMEIAGLPAGHYQICMHNFKGMTHVEKIEIEIMIEFTQDEKDKMKKEQDRHPILNKIWNIKSLFIS